LRIDFFAEGNPSCDITTYQGGWRCCEDGKFLIELDDVDVDDLPYDEVHGKFIFTYLDDDAHELGLKQLQFITQDASGYLDVTKGNIEYDVPACDLRNTRPEDCIYESSTVNFISGEIDADDDSLMSIPYTVGHLHVGGIDVTLYDDDTGEVICRSEAIYGNGTEAGNENGYLIGMTPCSFLTPPVFPKNKKVRTVARYNNTEPHTGVMGLMLSTMYEVPA